MFSTRDLSLTRFDHVLARERSCSCVLHQKAQKGKGNWGYGSCEGEPTYVILPALADGRLKLVIDKVFPLKEALVTQDYLAENTFLGKIISTV